MLSCTWWSNRRQSRRKFWSHPRSTASHAADLRWDSNEFSSSFGSWFATPHPNRSLALGNALRWCNRDLPESSEASTKADGRICLANFSARECIAWCSRRWGRVSRPVERCCTSTSPTTSQMHSTRPTSSSRRTPTSQHQVDAPRNVSARSPMTATFQFGSRTWNWSLS